MLDPEILYGIGIGIAAVLGYVWQHKRDRADMQLILDLVQRVAVLESVIANMDWVEIDDEVE